MTHTDKVELKSNMNHIDTQFLAHSPADGDLGLYLGQILQQAGQMTDAQVEQVLKHQRATGLRFGEAAVALRLTTPAAVLHALGRQFHYPYAPTDKQAFSPELVTAVSPFCKQAEAFRAVRTQVLNSAFKTEGGNHALAVISPNTGDGKTFFAANLAVVLSQLGGDTLLIDADMRNPRQHRLFGIPNTHGLSTILAGRISEKLVTTIAHLPNLHVLTAGPTPPNPTELVERPAFSILIDEFTRKFDFVILDTPAAVHGADCAAIVYKTRSALCIARSGKSHARALEDLTMLFSSGDVALAGMIYNNY
jgi:protein-tyrosine kinase